jgi:hypothetical protein
MNLQFDLISKLSEGLKDAADKLIVPDAVKWIEKEFYIPETRNDPKLHGRIQLMDYQNRLVRCQKVSQVDHRSRHQRIPRIFH